ncbi:MAG: hypothetical protein OXG62_05545 [Nitrospinae bacterium]|nr:hypothetical protein [Nitrospinota bacterium]
MLFCVKTPINKLYVFAVALLLAVTLAGCSGSGGGTATTPTEPPVTPEPTPQEMCEADGGRWNADMTCTSAEELEAERMAMEAARVAAVTKAAETKAEAINNEGTESTTAPFDSANAAENYTVTAAHEDGAVAVKIAVPGAAMDDPAFMRAESLAAVEGWDGSMHALGPNDDGETEIVGVYTDIAAPKPTEFATVYPLDLSTNTDNDTPAVTNEALTITADNVTMLASPSFRASGAALLTFNAVVDDDASTTDVNESAPAFEAMGTFDGAPGTLKCNSESGGNCTITLDADGKVTNAAGSWIFTPAAGAMVDVPDADYFYYGFWLKKTEEDGATTYNAVQTFVGAVGINVFPITDISNVFGTASYEGGAGGVYVKKTFTADGKVDTATSGTFTANVGLTAYFGGNDVAVNKQYSVEGSVSDFVLSGGEENAWSVNLKADYENTTNQFSGTANGGGDEAAWNGAFYGAAEDTPAEDDGAARLAPASVLGEFNANFSNGHVAGAFSAHRQ